MIDNSFKAPEEKKEDKKVHEFKITGKIPSGTTEQKLEKLFESVKSGEITEEEFPLIVKKTFPEKGKPIIKEKKYSPQAKSLIRVPAWYPSRKGIKPIIEEKAITVEGKTSKMEVTKYEGKQISFEFVTQFSLPTVFTFKVVSAVSDLFLKYRAGENYFYTSLSEIARVLQIPEEGRYLADIRISLFQIHNVFLSYSKLWPKIKMRIFTVEEENFEGKRPYKIRFNEKIAEELITNRFTLLDLSLPISQGASLLLARLKQDKNVNPLYGQATISNLLNLRGVHRFKVIEKYAIELQKIGFLQTPAYTIIKAKGRGKNIAFHKIEGWKSKEDIPEILKENPIQKEKKTDLDMRFENERKLYAEQKRSEEKFDKLPEKMRVNLLRKASDLIDNENYSASLITKTFIKSRAIAIMNKKGV